MSIIKRIILESFTGENQKFSSKKLQMFAAFASGLIMAFIDQLTSYKINYDVFLLIMIMAGYMPALRIADQKINSSETIQEPDKTKTETE